MTPAAYAIALVLALAVIVAGLRLRSRARRPRGGDAGHLPPSPRGVAADRLRYLTHEQRTNAWADAKHAAWRKRQRRAQKWISNVARTATGRARAKERVG